MMVQTLTSVPVICGSNDDNDDEVGGKWAGAPIFDHLRGFAAPIQRLILRYSCPVSVQGLFFPYNAILES